MKKVYFLAALLVITNLVSAQKNVGIGNSSPLTKLDVSGALALREGVALSLSNGGVRNGVNDTVKLTYITGTTDIASFYHITGPTAAFSIYGLVPVTGANGQIVTLVNNTGHTMTIINEDSYLTGDSIYTQTGGNLVDNAGATAGSSVTLQYSQSAGGTGFPGWLVISVENFKITAASVANNATFNNGGSGAVSGSTYDGASPLTISYNTIGAPSTTGTGASGTWGINITGNAATATSVANNATFNNGGSGAASGSTYDGASPLTISYNTIGAPSTTGVGASGTWGINITGNAATATSATTAGSVTNNATFNNSGSGAVSGSTYDGASPLTISYNTIGAPSTTGAGASGTWGISITGNAATATSATTAGSVANALTIGSGLSLSSGTTYNGSAAVTLTNAGVTSITGTANEIIASAATGGVTLSTPQAIATSSSPSFTGLTVSGLSAGGPVYATSGTGALTLSAPISGTNGYWSRSGTTLSPSNAGDAVTVTNSIAPSSGVSIGITGTESGTPTSTGTVYGVEGVVSGSGALASGVTGVGVYGSNTSNGAAGNLVGVEGSVTSNNNGGNSGTENLYGALNQAVDNGSGSSANIYGASNSASNTSSGNVTGAIYGSNNTASNNSSTVLTGSIYGSSNAASFASSGAVTGNMLGSYNTATFSGGSTGTVGGIWAGSYSWGYLNGNPSSSVPAIYGTYALVSTGSGNTSQTITNAYGVGSTFAKSGQTISNAVAFYGVIPAGVATTSYGIYTTGENYDYFSGKVGIGITTPAVKLDIENGSTSPALKVVDGTQGLGKVLTSDASGNASWLAPATNGTVTSVGLSLPAIFTVTNSPVTTSGTLTGTLASETANTFLAAPNGSAGTPTFRAIVAADVPTLNQNTSGSAGSVLNSVTFNNGGAGGASGITYNGGTAQTVSYNTIGAAPLASPTFTGVPAAPTAALNTNTTQLATTAFVLGQASTTTPLALGTAAVGTGTTFARADHVHPAINLTTGSGTTYSGNLPVTNLNSGTSAGATTFWCGNGTWAAPPITTANISGTAGQVAYFSAANTVTSSANNTFAVNPAGAGALVTTNTSATTASVGILGTESGNGNVSGVQGSTTSTTAGGSGVSGYATGTTGATYGVYGQSSSTTAGASGIAGSASGTTGATYGVFGQSSSTTGEGVYGVDNAAGVVDGVYGSTSSTTTNADGVFGFATGASTSVHGVVGQTNSGTGFGMWGANNVATSSSLPAIGVGALGGGGGTLYSYYTSGAGLAATGTNFGASSVFTSTSSSTNNAAYYGADVSGSQYAYVAYYSGSTNYKIIGTGTVSTIIHDPSDPSNHRELVLHAPESPEVYFTDFGQANLVNGFAHVEIDPLLAPSLIINEKHPLRVFLQIEDNDTSEGLIVKNKTTHGFDVVERKGGTSNLTFQWSIIANRADEVSPVDGSVSKYANLRLEKAPEHPQVSAVQAVRKPVPSAVSAPAAQAVRQAK